MKIEPLETRIAPAAVFTFTDVDGDFVTITSSRGADADLAAAGVVVLAVTGLGEELQRIDLSLNAAVFAGANLTVTATRTAAGGDGLANVGYIDASTAGGGVALDLGMVSVRGDLGRIDAGDAVLSTAAVRKLTVQSMGQFGTSTQQAGGSLESNLNGALGSLKVAGSVKEAYLNVEGGMDGRIGSVTIGGSLLGGAAGNSGRLLSSGPMGPVNILGDVRGGDALSSGSVYSADTIARVTVGGSLVGGAGISSGTIYGSAALGPVKIAGNIQGGTNFSAGSIGSGGPLTSVTVGGSVLGGSEDGSGAIDSMGAMGPVKIAGSLIGGPASDSGSITSDGAIATVRIGGDVRGGDGENTGLIASSAAMAGVTIVGSLAGSSGDRSGGIDCVGALGPVRIGGNIQGADVDGAMIEETGFISAGRLASLFVGGSIIAGIESGGGTLIDSGAVRVSADIGPITVKGSLLGHSTNPVLITAQGQPVPGATTDVAIKSLTVTGRVERADILAGYNTNDTPFATNADAQIGPVVAGDWIASNLVAGVQDDADAARDDFFGDGDDEAIAGGSAGIVSRIASILIKGTAFGTVGVADFFGFAAQHIGSFKVGATPFALTPGAGNDLAFLPVGAIGDLRLREFAVP